VRLWKPRSPVLIFALRQMASPTLSSSAACGPSSEGTPLVRVVAAEQSHSSKSTYQADLRAAPRRQKDAATETQKAL